MLTLVAPLTACGEEGLTFVARTSHSLARLLVNEVRTARLAGLGQRRVLLAVIAVVGDDGRVLLVGLDQGSTPLAAGNLLGLGALGRIALVLGRATAGAFLCGTEGGAAGSAGAMHTHADGFLDTESGTLGGVPLALLDLEAILSPSFLARSSNRSCFATLVIPSRSSYFPFLASGAGVALVSDLATAAGVEAGAVGLGLHRVSVFTTMGA